MSKDTDGHDGKQKVGERQGKSSSEYSAENVEIEAESGFEKNDDQSDCRKDRTDGAKVLRCYEMKNRTENQANDGKQENVRNTRAAKQAREGMRHEDEESNGQDVRGDVHGKK